MEKGGARLFQQTNSTAFEQNWNIVELETRKQIRQQVNILLRQAHTTTITTNEVRQQLLQGITTFGIPFAIQLVRSLHRDNDAERQSVIWLLVTLNEKETIPPLQQMMHNPHLPRVIRLSAALALAGMGVTAETVKQRQRVCLYAIS